MDGVELWKGVSLIKAQRRFLLQAGYDLDCCLQL